MFCFFFVEFWKIIGPGGGLLTAPGVGVSHFHCAWGWGFALSKKFPVQGGRSGLELTGYIITQKSLSYLHQISFQGFSPYDDKTRFTALLSNVNLKQTDVMAITSKYPFRSTLRQAKFTWRLINESS